MKNNIYAKNVGKNIRAARLGAGLTTITLAQIAGITPLTLRRIEVGEQFPRPRSFKAIADALKVDPKDLFKDTKVDDSPQQINQADTLLIRLLTEAHQELGVCKRDLEFCRQKIKDLEAQLQ
jgi:transcriptional regulator with XRE-family HTH domain